MSRKSLIVFTNGKEEITQAPRSSPKIKQLIGDTPPPSPASVRERLSALLIRRKMPSLVFDDISTEDADRLDELTKVKITQRAYNTHPSSP